MERENSSASFAGVAASRAPVDFLINGAAGRTLDVRLQGEDEGTYLHIHGLDDGVQLARLPDRRTSYGSRLPSTQDYVISVVPAGEGTKYELLVTMR